MNVEISPDGWPSDVEHRKRCCPRAVTCDELAIWKVSTPSACGLPHVVYYCDAHLPDEAVNAMMDTP